MKKSFSFAEESDPDWIDFDDVSFPDPNSVSEIRAGVKKGPAEKRLIRYRLGPYFYTLEPSAISSHI